MGNRAVIQVIGCDAGIYIHWNGGRASVEGFLQAARGFGVGGDPQYVTARLVQIIGNWMGGTLSVGVDAVIRLDCDNGDNGVYFVDPVRLTIKKRQFEPRDGEEVNADKTAQIKDEAIGRSSDAFMRG
jgi:hypothetical protein